MRQHADAMWMSKSRRHNHHVARGRCALRMCLEMQAATSYLATGRWALFLWCYIRHFGLELYLSISHAAGKFMVLWEH